MADAAKNIIGSIEISQEKIRDILDFKKKFETALQKRTTEVLEVILGGAIDLSASDIHLEPEEKEVKIRLRIDGVLQDILHLNADAYSSILSRIKLISGIKLNISDRPQDGRFSIATKEIKIEVRVSTLPAEYGETTVMRVLNPKSLISLKDLGLRDDLAKIFNRELKKPNGMIIVTGPTGSGKTTTLYAFLKEISSPETKTITIEDPIEYHLPGISQTQVAPQKGYDFASGLRSIVRQDPDVILVGEIRDLETANIALQASLTGHLVFTTLHTNDAAGTIARLVNLGAKPADIGPAVNLAIAQRLLRKVCKTCAKFEKPEHSILENFKKELRLNMRRSGIPAINEKTKFPKAAGCNACNFTGYKGRVGIFEAFLIDDKMEKFILKNPSIAALREEAIKKGGMTTMKQDGFVKILQGTTTLEEVERVIGE